MKIYLVKSLCDYKYGVEAVCTTEKDAKTYIEKHGGNFDVEFWMGKILPHYVIEECGADE